MLYRKRAEDAKRSGIKMKVELANADVARLEACSYYQHHHMLSEAQH